MTSERPIKSSSRAGRFKKKLVTAEELVREAPELLPRLASLHELHVCGKLSGAEFTACYILQFLAHRFPGTWLGSQLGDQRISGTFWRDLPLTFEPNITRRLSSTQSVLEIIANFSLRSTPRPVNRAVVEWHSGRYALDLMFRIPTPAEVLAQQKQGRRCVTTLIDDRIGRYVLGERDALSFTMHDLIHADHFYHHNACFIGQLGFYGLLAETLPYFEQTNEGFAAEFDYLISDMNAYPIHLLKCLKSAMIHYFDEEYFLGWIQNLSAPEALKLLNTNAYAPERMDSEILGWLERFRSFPA